MLRITNKEEIGGKVSQDKKTLRFKIFNSDFEIFIPENIKTIKISQFGGNLSIDSDIKKIVVNSKGGDIHISNNALEELKIRSMGGNINIALLEDINATFEIENLSGSFSSEIPYETIHKGRKNIVGKINKGENGKITIHSLGANIYFKKKEAK